MDISEKYIKMCEKTDEIQSIKPDFEDSDQNFVANFHEAKACPTHGNNHLWTKYEKEFYCPKCGVELVGVKHIPEFEDYEQKGAYKTVWLPRQDQLQEMIFEPFGKNFVFWLYRFHDYAENQESHESMIGGCYSMEQLWLAFVMHECYEKYWDNENWIKDR